MSMFQFTPSMASILMALPRNKRTEKDPATLTVDALSETVRLRPTTVMDWLDQLCDLGLVLQVGKRAAPTRDKKWQLSANGRKVVRVLTGAV
jgi:DNA-binding IclR family transcriptional regulator